MLGPRVLTTVLRTCVQHACRMSRHVLGQAHVTVLCFRAQLCDQGWTAKPLNLLCLCSGKQ